MVVALDETHRPVLQVDVDRAPSVFYDNVVQGRSVCVIDQGQPCYAGERIGMTHLLIQYRPELEPGPSAG